MVDRENYLLSLAIKGDLDAFEKLSEAYYKKVFNIAFKITADSNSANEMAQEVFVRVYRAVKSKGYAGPFQLCVYKTVKDVCLEGWVEQGESRMAVAGKTP